MQTLLLSSSGVRSEVPRRELLKILPKEPTQTKLAHIITAAMNELDQSYFEKDRKALDEMEFQVEEVDIAGKTADELRELLSDKDVIYMQGGNPFYLLKQIRASGFDIVIKELIDRGVIYFGTSAGSYVMTPSIETGVWKRDKNTYGLTDWSGMNFVPFLIFAHYKDEHMDKIKEHMKNTKYDVRILTDDQALLVQDGKVKLLGKGNEIKVK